MSLITEADRTAYERDGVVHIRGAFKDWVSPLVRGYDAAIEAYDAGVDLTLLENAPPSAALAPPYIQRGRFGGTNVLNMAPYVPAMVDWVSQSDAARLCAELSGSRTMRFWQDAVFEKNTSEPDNGTPWHNDECTWPFWGDKMPILWIALTDVGPKDAPLRTLIGSHKIQHRYYSWISKQGLAVNDVYHPWEELLAKVSAPDADIRTWEVAAGDCLVLHPRTVHSSASRTETKPGRRLSFSTRWLGDDAIWAPDDYSFREGIEQLEAHPAMRPGEAPPAALFPAIWDQERSEGVN